MTNPTGFTKTIKVNVANKDEFITSLNLKQENTDLKLLSERNVNDLIELEFLSNVKGVLQVMSQISNTDVLATLRIFDLDKVSFNSKNKKAQILKLNFEAIYERRWSWTYWLFK